MSKPPSEYDEEFVVSSKSTFINISEMIDNVILSELANQNLAPRPLIKKRAENRRTTIATSKTDSNEHFFFQKLRKRSIANKDSNSVLLKSSQNQSVLTRTNSLENSANFVKVIQKDAVDVKTPKRVR